MNQACATSIRAREWREAADEGDGVVTLASKILAVAATREAAEDVLRIRSYSVGSSVINVWIEESTLVDW